MSLVGLELWVFYTYQSLLHILTEKEHILNRWKEYFERVLAGNLNDIDSMTFYTVENEDIQLSYEELTYVIKYLKKP
jgi:predicted transcriptional regulator